MIDYDKASVCRINSNAMKNETRTGTCMMLVLILDMVIRGKPSCLEALSATTTDNADTVSMRGSEYPFIIHKSFHFKLNMKVSNTEC
jgi:hypothetical protein